MIAIHINKNNRHNYYWKAVVTDARLMIEGDKTKNAQILKTKTKRITIEKKYREAVTTEGATIDSYMLYPKIIGEDI